MIDAQSILIAVLSSGVTGGAIAFVLKRFVERSIEHKFRMIELTKELELTQASGARSVLFEKEMLVYPEINEVIYRSRNAARACVTQATRTRAALRDFQACKIHLTENLFKYQIFVPDSEFRALHRFKTEMQEFGVLLDEITRSQRVEDTPVNPKLQEVASEQLVKRFATIEELYQSLVPKLKDAIRAKTEIRS